MAAPSSKPFHPLRWAMLVLMMAVLCALLGWWFAGGRVWTDGSDVRVSASETRVRQIIWTPPESLNIAAGGSAESADQPSLSPDGNELFFARGSATHHAHIYVTRRQGSGWDEPVALAAVNSDAEDLGPRVTADGRYLLIASNRAGGFGGFDIWASTRGPGGTWGTPFNLGPGVNSAFDELSPDPTPEGQHLIFSTNRKSASKEQAERWKPRNRPSGSSDFDLWLADLSEAAVDPKAGLQSNQSVATTAQPEIASNLSSANARAIPSLNTAYVEGASCMSPAGDFLYFSSDRPGGYGRLDLYRSRVTPDWNFGVPENLGPAVNTADNEDSPSLAIGGYRLYFSSDRGPANSASGLFSTDSREVFLQRQYRPLPQLSRSWLVMLASLALLLPLMFLMRGWGDNRLSMLQRCLLLSVLIHVVVSFCLSFINVSQQVRQYVKKETGVDIGLNLPKELAVGLSIRNDDTSDAPRPSPVTPLPQINAPIEPPPLPAGPSPLDVRPAPAAPGGVAVDVQLPRLTTPPLDVKPPVLSPQAIAPPAPLIDIKPAMPRAPLAQADPVLPPVPPAPQPLTAAPNQVVLIAPPLPAPAVDPAVKPQAIPLPQSPPAPQAPIVYASPLDRSTPPVTPAAAPLSPAPVPQIAPAKPQQLAIANPVEPLAPKLPAPGDVARMASRDPVAARPVLPPPPAMAAPAKPDNQIASALLPAVGPPHPGVGAGDVGGLPVRADITAAHSVVGPQVALALSTARRPPDSQPALAGEKLASDAPRSLSPATRPSNLADAVTDPKALSPDALALGPADRSSPQPSDASAAAPALLRPDRAASLTHSSSSPEAVDHAAPAPEISLAPASHATAMKQPTPDESFGQLAISPPASPIDQPLARAQPDGATGDGAAIRPPAQTVPGGVSPATADSGHQSLISVPGTPTPTDHRASQGTPGAIAAAQPSGLAGAIPGPQVAFPAAPGTGGGFSGETASDELPRLSSNAVPPSAREPLSATGRQSAPRNVLDLSPSAPLSHQGDVATGDNTGHRHGPPGAIASGVPQPAVGPVLLPGVSDASAPAAQPQVAIAPLPGAVGPSHFNTPVSPLTQRAPALRKPLVEKLGGSGESEGAVDHALGYLSRQQEPDGRWTFVNDESRPGKRGKSPHDMAYTGLAVLSFLARDHTPDKPGPYREAVASGIQYLLDQQDRTGDLRGPPEQRGGGSGRGNMYDHAIATLALAEAAMMTQDQRCAAAVNAAAQFIVEGQNQQNGGWRYIPNELGDTSVFGWEIMALHSAELLGFHTPDLTRRRALRFVELVTGGRRKMLAAYQPGGLATPTMTAEMVFCRMLLGQKLDDADVQEATDFLAQNPPEVDSPDLYYWYYASQCMMQMQSKSWKSWNSATRDGLIRLQHRGGFVDGSWSTTSPRSERGGYIFTTAIATLTLEVYYRYAHLLDQPPGGETGAAALPGNSGSGSGRHEGDDAVPSYRKTRQPRLDAN